MTSTSFNVGIQEARNSSRVLRPPGGGHTPLFGPADPEPPKKYNGRNASSITEGRSECNVVCAKPAPEPIKTVTPTAPEPAAAPAPPPTAAAAPPVAAKAPPSAVKAPPSAAAVPAAVAAPAPVQAAPAPQPQRTKVPPGGFSSGLW